MTDDTALLPLDWTIAVEAVPEGGAPWRAEASDAERAAVVAALSLVSLDALVFAGKLERRAGGVYRIAGKVTAVLAQACVVSLDPVAVRLAEPLDVTFTPDLGPALGPESAAAKGEDIEVSSVDADVEPIVRGKLELGRVVFETFAAALDPYPRSPGVDFDAMTAAPQGATPAGNPFAVLSDFKPKKGT